jgi:hypothetical protein
MLGIKDEYVDIFGYSFEGEESEGDSNACTILNPEVQNSLLSSFSLSSSFSSSEMIQDFSSTAEFLFLLTNSHIRIYKILENDSEENEENDNFVIEEHDSIVLESSYEWIKSWTFPNGNKCVFIGTEQQVAYLCDEGDAVFDKITNLDEQINFDTNSNLKGVGFHEQYIFFPGGSNLYIFRYYFDSNDIWYLKSFQVLEEDVEIQKIISSGLAEIAIVLEGKGIYVYSITLYDVKDPEDEIELQVKEVIHLENIVELVSSEPDQFGQIILIALTVDTISEDEELFQTIYHEFYCINKRWIERKQVSYPSKLTSIILNHEYTTIFGANFYEILKLRVPDSFGLSTARIEEGLLFSGLSNPSWCPDTSLLIFVTSSSMLLLKPHLSEAYLQCTETVPDSVKIFTISSYSQMCLRKHNSLIQLDRICKGTNQICIKSEKFTVIQQGIADEYEIIILLASIFLLVGMISIVFCLLYYNNKHKLQKYNTLENLPNQSDEELRSVNRIRFDSFGVVLGEGMECIQEEEEKKEKDNSWNSSELKERKLINRQSSESVDSQDRNTREEIKQKNDSHTSKRSFIMTSKSHDMDEKRYSERSIPFTKASSEFTQRPPKRTSEKNVKFREDLFNYFENLKKFD